MKKTLRSKSLLTLLLLSLTAGLCACTSQTQTEQTEPQTTEAPTEVSTEASAEESTEETYVLSANSPLTNLPEYTYDSWDDYRDMENGAEMLGTLPRTATATPSI